MEAEMTAAKPTIRPADRSVPAMSSVKQMPSAMMRRVEDWVRMSSATRICMNRGWRTQMTMTSTSIASRMALLVRNEPKVLRENTTSPSWCFEVARKPLIAVTAPMIIRKMGRS